MNVLSFSNNTDVAGLPTDRFFFAGFPPTAAGARRRFLEELAAVPGTLVFFESPKRVSKLLTELSESLGESRAAAVCRELTKRFEEVRRGTLGELAAHYAGATPKGEIVVVVDRGQAAGASPEQVEEALRTQLSQGSVKDAVAAVTAAFGLPRKEVYRMALALEKKR